MYSIVYEDNKYARGFINSVDNAIKSELASKGLGDVKCVKAADKDRGEDNVLLIVGTADLIKRIIDGESDVFKCTLPIDVVVVLEKGTWSEKLEYVIKSPNVNVLHIVKLNGETAKSEDVCAFCDTVKELVRCKIRSNGKYSEEDESQSKAIDWKCSVNNAGDTVFFSFFSDPSMRDMCRELKNAVLGLKEGVGRLSDKKYKKEWNIKPNNEGVIFDNLPATEPIKPPSILLLGETGSGKSLAAKWVADALEFGNKLESQNIGAMTGGTIYSRLFGACKGSYTDAGRDMPGIFIENVGKAIFLDEIGDATPECQVSLLKYLDASEVRPLGWSGKNIYAPTLIIAATNKPLDKLVNQGNKDFRNDLFYRFDYVVHLPPLRERKKDLRFLISMLLQNENVNPKTGSEDKKVIERISIDAIEYLERQEYPGNFRELQDKIRRAVQKAERSGSKTICLRHVVD